jgi:hypothetical protein
MKAIARILVFAIELCLFSVFCNATNNFEYVDRTYTINLKSSPDSFRDIVKNYTIGSEIMKRIHNITWTIGRIFGEELLSRVWGNYQVKPEFRAFVSEMDAIKRGLNSFVTNETRPVTTFQIFLINLLYEFDAQCTAVMAVQQPEDVVRLAHNLDFTNQDFFRKIYVATGFVNDTVIFNCSGPAGNIGGMMCTRIGNYSIAINERALHDKDRMEKNLKEGRWPTMWLIRKVLTTCSTYEEAVKELRTQTTVSGSYLSIAGARVGVNATGYYDGIILTKSPDSVDHEEHLTSTRRFLLQCNTDWDKTNDTTDPTIRTKKGLYALEDIHGSELKEKFTSQQLRDYVLKNYPNLRTDNDTQPKDQEGTVSIVSMEPSGPDPIKSWIYWPPKENTCLNGKECNNTEGDDHGFCCCDVNGRNCKCCLNRAYRCYNIDGNECVYSPASHMLRGF